MRELGEQILPLFTQVLLTCDRQGLISRQMFAIDGVKLPSNASKERSGTHAELRHRADRLDKAARKMIELHRSRDDGADEGAPDAQRRQRIGALQKEVQATRDFLARERQRRNRMGQELKSNGASGRSRSACSGRATSSWTTRPTAASARPVAGCTAAAI